VSRQGVEGLPGPGVSVPRAVHRPSRPSVPCHVVPVSLQALWLARHCLRALVGCPLLPAAQRGPPVRTEVVSVRGLPSPSPCPSLLAHVRPSTGPGSPGGSSPRRQWWQPWLDHATGTTLAWPAAAAVPGPLLSQLLSAFWARELALCAPLAVPPAFPSDLTPALIEPGPHGRLCALLPSFGLSDAQVWVFSADPQPALVFLSSCLVSCQYSGLSPIPPTPARMGCP